MSGEVEGDWGRRGEVDLDGCLREGILGDCDIALGWMMFCDILEKKFIGSWGELGS